MQNSKTRIFGIVTILAGIVLSLALMYVLTAVVGMADLMDDEMSRSLLLPVVMAVVTLISYLIWFSSKAKKFTSGQYPTLDPKYYSSGLTFALTSIIQYLVAFLVTIPLFAFYIAEISVPMLLPLAIVEIVFLIVNGLCFWVWRPVGNMQM